MSLRIKTVVDKFVEELKEALDAEIQDRIMKEREMQSYIEEREREVAEREAALKAELSRREVQFPEFPLPFNIYHQLIHSIHLEEGPGDILVFLSGQEEIESIEGLVRENLKKLPEACQKLLILPLFSSLPSEKQLKVFTPAPVEFRKVILATNIAETSVTIPGIKYVIDPGLVKVRSYSPDSGIESLIVVKTSKAQALQRSASTFDSWQGIHMDNSTFL
ncbi:hypothetical protein L6452_32883 [Arctium lappa]|uniref:Uncharacterized protein n=1 Tax=Arctium lappa TaxID=4217 RepID=A0ACB8ZA64_ARCLA|nr:hypothetical protein L6452_32883 [Arctium lappa]